jgi:hypothetical protein
MRCRDVMCCDAGGRPFGLVWFGLVWFGLVVTTCTLPRVSTPPTDIECSYDCAGDVMALPLPITVTVDVDVT